MYKQYSIQFPVLTSEINDALKLCPGFLDLMNQLQYDRADVIAKERRRRSLSSPFGKISTDIASLLIQPIQRIPRYLMLVESVLKSTSKHHPDYTVLEKCMKEIGAVAQEINSALAMKQKQMKVLKFSDVSSL